MKKVIGYLRVSTGSQDVKRQKMLISEFTKSKGYDLITYISDEGISGACDNREGLISLYNLTSSDCDLIVITEFSRFSRKSSMIAVANDIKTIVDKGIDIHILNTDKTITKGFDEEILDVLTLVIESNGAAKERARIRERMISGKLNKMNSNPLRVSGAVNLFGYDVDSNSNIVVNDEEAEIVKDIFSKYANGWSSSDIYKYLITNNLANYKKWCSSEIAQLLRHNRYIGMYEATLSGKTVSKHYPELQIIDNDLFQRVAEKIEENKCNRGGKSATHNADAVLRDVIKCGHCGGTYSARLIKVSWGQRLIYRCLYNLSRTPIHKEKCLAGKSIPLDLSEKAVVKAISSDAIVTRVNESANITLANNVSAINTLTDKVASYNKHNEELNEKWLKYFDKAIKYDIPDTTIDEYKSDINKQKNFNNELIKKSLSEIKKLKSINNHLNNLSDNTYSDMINEVNGDRGKAKQLVNEFIDTIYVFVLDKFVMLQIIRKDGNEQYIFIKKCTRNNIVYHITSHDYQFIDGKFHKGTATATPEEMFNLILNADTDLYTLDLN